MKNEIILIGGGIFNDWLKKSEYEFAGHEFEYNDEKMFEENPNYIDLFLR